MNRYMGLSLLFALAVVLMSLVSSANAYGSIYADRVEPAVEGTHTFIQAIRSENGVTTELNPSSLEVTGRSGIVAEIPNGMDITTSTLAINSLTGTFLGDQSTSEIGIYTGFFHVDSVGADIEASDSVSFEISNVKEELGHFGIVSIDNTARSHLSGATTAVHSEYGILAQTNNGNIHVSASEDLALSSNSTTITADRELYIASSAKNVYITSSLNTNIVSNNILLAGELSAQLVTLGDLTLTTQKIVSAKAGEMYITALNGITASSTTEDVTLTAGTLLSVNAPNGITLGMRDASADVFIHAQGDSHSSLELAGTSINVAASGVVGNLNLFTDEMTITNTNAPAVPIKFTGDTTVVGTISTVIGTPYTTAFSATSSGTISLSAVNAAFSAASTFTVTDTNSGVAWTSSGGAKFSAANKATLTAAGTFNVLSGGAFSINSVDPAGGLVIQSNAVNTNSASFSLNSQSVTIGTGAITGGASDIAIASDIGGVVSIRALGAQSWSGASLTMSAPTDSLKLQSTGALTVQTTRALAIDAASHTLLTTPATIKSTSDTLRAASGNDLDFSSGISIQFTGTSDASLIATNAIRFSQVNAQVKAGETTFKAGRDTIIKSSATSTVNLAGTLTAAVTGRAAFSGAITQIKGTNSVSVLGGDHRFVTDSSTGLGIRFTASNDFLKLTSTAGTVEWDSSEGIAHSTKSSTWQQANTISVVGIDFAQISTTNGAFASVSSTTTTFTSDNDINAVATATTSVNTFGNILLKAGRDALFTTGATKIDSDSVISIAGGSTLIKTSDTGAVRGIVKTDLNVTSTLGDGSVFFLSKQLLIDSAQSISVANPQVLVLSTDYTADVQITDNSLLSLSAPSGVINAPLVTLNGATKNTLTASNGVRVDTGAKDDIIMTPSQFYLVQPSRQATLMSDGDLAFTAGLDINVVSDVTRLIGHNKASLTGKGIQVFSTDAATGSVKFTSGGSTSIRAAGPRLDIDSNQDIVTRAGGAVRVESTTDTFYVQTAATTRGDVRLSSDGGVFDAEGYRGLNVFAVGSARTPNANVDFLVGGAVNANSASGGVTLVSQGVVRNTTTSLTNTESSVIPGVVLESYDNNGNIALSADLANVYLLGKLGVSIDAQLNGGRVSGEYGIDVTAGENILLSANSGEFHASGATGLSVQAGSETEPDNLVINATRLFSLQAADSISLRSEGIVRNDGITVQSAFGSVRFATSNNKDVVFDAERALAVQSTTASVVGVATDDVNVITYNGPTALKAQKDVSFVSAGGPIVFDTYSGNGGIVSMQSTNDHIAVSSGGANFVSAYRTMDLLAFDGVNINAPEGRIEVSVEATDKRLTLSAGGSIHVTGTSSEEPVALRAENNVEIDAQETVSVNSVRSFTIGKTTRPLVRFNAGGSATAEGYTVVSDGEVLVSTQRTLDVNTDVDFDTLALSAIDHVSQGPSTVKSLAGNVAVRALTGSAVFSGGLLTVSGDAAFNAKSNGNFEITSTGRASNDRIEIIAPTVLTTGVQYKAQATELNGLVGDKFFFRVQEQGTISTKYGSGGLISIGSARDFVAEASGEVLFSTEQDDSPITFETIGANSQLSVITHDESSPITFRSAGELTAKATTTKFVGGTSSATEGIIIESINTGNVKQVNNDDGVRSDIQVYASSNISVNTQSRASIYGETGVVISTRYIDGADNGGAVSFDSGRHVELDANGDFRLSTTAQDGGSIRLFAFDDVALGSTARGNSNVRGGDVRINADLDLKVTANKDLHWFIDGRLKANIDSTLTLQANGRSNGFSRESIRIETQGATNSELRFESLRGSTSMDGLQDVWITAGVVNDPIVTVADIVVNSEVGGEMATTFGDVLWTSSTGAALIQAQKSDIELLTLGAETITVGTALTMSAAGQAENGLWGMRFGSSAGSGSVSVTAPTVTFNAFGEVALEGSTVGITALKSVKLFASGYDSEVAFNSAGNFSLTATAVTLTPFTIDSTIGDVNFTASGTVEFLANDKLTIDTANADAVFQTSPVAFGADVVAYAYDTLTLTAPRIRAEASGPEGADLVVRSPFGRVQMTSLFKNTMNEGHGMIFLTAADGDVSLSSSNVYPAYFKGIRELGFGVRGRATFDAGVQLSMNVGSTILIETEQNDQRYSGKTVAFSGQTLTSASRQFHTKTSGDISFNSGAGISVSSVGRDQPLWISSNGLPDDSSNLLRSIRFHPQGPNRLAYTTDLHFESKFLIPFTEEHITNGLACSVERQMVYSVGEFYEGHLCVCSSYGTAAPLDQSFVNSRRWVCIDFALLQTSA